MRMLRRRSSCYTLHARLCSFLYMQGLRSSESVGFWLPMRMQEHSARARDSHTMPKQYVTSDQLGSDDNSPLCQFPKLCADLASELDPKVHPVAMSRVLCWLCGAGFLSWQALYRHTCSAHGG